MILYNNGPIFTITVVPHMDKPGWSMLFTDSTDKDNFIYLVAYCESIAALNELYRRKVKRLIENFQVIESNAVKISFKPSMRIYDKIIECGRVK